MTTSYAIAAAEHRTVRNLDPAADLPAVEADDENVTVTAHVGCCAGSPCGAVHGWSMHTRSVRDAA